MIFIVGASGSGKTYLFNRLIMDYPYIFNKIPSYTTRKPRKGELEEGNYIFLSKSEFVEKIKAGFFVEYNTYADSFYGTALEDMEKSFGIKMIEPGGLVDIMKNDTKNKHCIVYVDTRTATRINRMFSRGDNFTSVIKRIVKDTKVFNKKKFDNYVDLWIDNNEDLTDQKIEHIFRKIKLKNISKLTNQN